MVLSGVQEQVRRWQKRLLPERVVLAVEDQSISALVRRQGQTDWCERLPLPEGFMHKGVPTQTAALRELLADWLVERGWWGAQLVVGLPRSACVWRLVMCAPHVDPVAQCLQSTAMLGIEALDPGGAGWRLCPLPHGVEGCDPVHLLVGLAGVEAMAWLQPLIEEGFTLEAVEAAQVSTWRAVQARWSDQPSLLLLDVQPEQLWFTLFEQGLPRFEWTSTTLLTPEAVVQQIRSLALFWRRQAWPLPPHVVITGDGACLPRLDGVLASELGWSLEFWEPLGQSACLEGLCLAYGARPR